MPDKDDKKPKSNDIEDLLAVALEYDVDEDPAPKLSAKGRGHLAQQIIEIARQNGVTIHRDADLAEVLSALEVDSVIPLETYVAVAEIISYIYRKNNSLKDT